MALQPEVLRAEPRQVEQVGDEALQPGRLRLDRRPGLGHPRAGRHPVGQRLGEAADRRQRRPQLVAHRQQELALPGLAARQCFRKSVDAHGHLGDLDRPFGAYADVPLTGGEPERAGGRVLERPGEPSGEQQRQAERDEQPGRQRQRDPAQHPGLHRARVGDPLHQDHTAVGGDRLDVHERALAVDRPRRLHRSARGGQRPVGGGDGDRPGRRPVGAHPQQPDPGGGQQPGGGAPLLGGRAGRRPLGEAGSEHRVAVQLGARPPVVGGADQPDRHHAGEQHGDGDRGAGDERHRPGERAAGAPAHGRAA